MEDLDLDEKEEYQELEVQQSYEPESNGHVEDLYGTYLSAEISLFGKAVMLFMLVSFAFAICLLVFSYTPWGIEFLRGLKIKII
ncbi:hypothetical protein A9Q84_17675 [Halobacteriovorax marinus]|uniref:Transmembrane protein n=1 Tax=Halobacteriovorax marinus TaxID=97084 RepID=A0A1Y5F9P1_9BACT|nr:hypothetical protein A9Q84_17675 [Halobacteriovorax marinus]